MNIVFLTHEEIVDRICDLVDQPLECNPERAEEIANQLWIDGALDLPDDPDGEEGGGCDIDEFTKFGIPDNFDDLVRAAALGVPE